MIILASASPRRAELLRAAGINFTVRAANINETQMPNETPRDYVARLAREKAQAVAQQGETVLGADTTVVINGGILGKPVGTDDAKQMLRALSGQWHEVLTGIAIVHQASGSSVQTTNSHVESTRVKLADLTDAEIEWYVATGEPMDKAGAYGIQDRASRFIERIEGSYSNVVGLPVRAVYKMTLENDFG